MRKKIPIGISDFKKLIEENFIYVDKTLLIDEIVERGGGGKVSLIPRMRRFGKTLNLSMLRYFFEKSKEDTSHLFSSLNIWKIEKYREMQGTFPVIFLSLKDIKYSSWENTFDAFRILIAGEFNRHAYLLEGQTLTQQEKKDFAAILSKEASEPLYAQSLLLLSRQLHRYHDKQVILLIDEYDTPAHAAYVGGYYDTLISFLRNWLSAGLKDNSSLEFGVLTGILRIAKESIFSGLYRNNLKNRNFSEAKGARLTSSKKGHCCTTRPFFDEVKVASLAKEKTDSSGCFGINNISTFSILNKGFQDKFGFLESEVQALVQEYGLESKLEEMRSWYDGYTIGSTGGIYNPWSVLKCIESQGEMEPFWVNTSDNALTTQLITKGPDELKADLEELMKGSVIEKTVEEGIIFDNLENNPDAIWSLLVFSGYLTLAAPFVYGVPCRLKIPNTEVRELYRTIILNWFKQSIHAKNYRLLLDSLITGDMATFSELFEKFVLSTFSVFDVTQEEPERVYHAFVLGMLVGLADTHEVKSNRESGFGRYDVTLFPKDSNGLGIIMEFKRVRSSEKIGLEEAAGLAFKQIEEKQYATELRDRGIKRILSIGLAFQGKKVLVRAQEMRTETN